MRRDRRLPSVRPMSKRVLTSVPSTMRAPVRFPSFLCGVDGSRIAAEAARQAAVEAIAAIAEATSTQPLVLDEHSTAHKAITGAAATMGAALAVIGSRGLHGVHALSSVSERVAHEAPCSVLVLRPIAPPGFVAAD